MKAKLGAIALAVASAFVGSAHAGTTFGSPYQEYVNGVWVGQVDGALWSDPATPFDLTSTTFWIEWFGSPLADNPLTSVDETDAPYTIYAFRNGLRVKSIDTRDIKYGEIRTATLNWTNLDLVTWSSAYSHELSTLYVLDVTGAGITPAVPEPETYAMMLAGLGITAMAARRRRKQA
ncbi:PEP-CTERM sorting domain-containing protein [Niveibacterium sp. 24ML]|uniref:PEP-CTERM sorting domain-containing protein n=1 Tax=Niveibacterium sp. 24ML TaxID=2985512 RepID=UPI00226F33AD|nr:PEP-CTERM sorting domain-containing protein [Niveibacterium sp. 24ML]MCX9158195.1 PEP-CTERM sorting domain-containing protein [Niveibacterium sp. 24ML]